MKIKHNTDESQNFARVSDIEIPEIYNRRFKCGKADLDAVFGDNGFLPGMSFTLAAGAGTGKTTMLIQMLELLEGQRKNCAYISAEESVHQLAFTCKRLNVTRVKVANMSVIEDIFDAVKANKFDMIILDSFPALTSRKKLRGKKLEEYLSNYICSQAKEQECVVGIILHMTKTGQYKGSTLLPHSVDCNVLMSRNTEDPTVREIEVTKNRFGGCYGMAFAMSEHGFNFEKVEIEGEEKKQSKSDKYKEQILEATKKNNRINLAQATEILGDISRSQMVLRELTLTGKLKKTGRGQTAFWTL
jgi:predicted ATP-dependent serine protease